MNLVSFEREIESIHRKEVEHSSSNNTYESLYHFLDRFKKSEHEIVLSIILPVFNEEKSINSLLKSLPNNKNIEIIVVDDHSTDNSAKEIQKIKNDTDIRFFRHEKNRGYGGAIITGVNQAKGKVIVTMDSDGQHNPLDIISVIKPVFENEADYTIGSRYLGSNHYDLPLITRVGEAMVEKFIQILFNKRVMNNQNGFRAFNRKTVPLFNEVQYYEFTFATEIILKLIMRGFRIKECPIKVYHRQFGSSKINLKKLTLNMFSCLLRYYLKKVFNILF